MKGNVTFGECDVMDIYLISMYISNFKFLCYIVIKVFFFFVWTNFVLLDILN
jgi:hypothetical protein